MNRKLLALVICMSISLLGVTAPSFPMRAMAEETKIDEEISADEAPSSLDSSIDQETQLEEDGPESDEVLNGSDSVGGDITSQNDEDQTGAEVNETKETSESPIREESSVAAPLSASIELSASTSTTAMYRLYNPNSGEHFYTASTYEATSLVNVGWRYEGVGWMAPKSSNSPVYRLYNPNAGDHHYTTSAYERDSLVRAGWRYEQIGWYSDDAKTVPLYRQYNPNARAGAHNFTASAYERDNLIGAGWRDEGIGWYGAGTSADDPAHGLLTRTPIVGSSTASASVMASYFKAMGFSYPSSTYSQYGAASIDDFCRILEEEANAEGVNPAVVFAQVMVETNYLKFGGGVSAAQCNFGNLADASGAAGTANFSSNGADSVRIGLRAQVQHLKAYATNSALANACVDPQYGSVQKGSAPYVENLGSGLWSNDASYASKVIKVLDAYAPTYMTSAEKSYSAVYNFEFYRSKYPDIAAAFGNDRAATLNHFLTNGVRERRQACATFSVQSYYNQYEDVRRAYGTNMLGMCQHYIQYGKAEGRAGTGCTTLQGSYQCHNIAWASQPNNYYCGPTAGYMILRNVGANRSASGDSLSINNVARYMETDRYGFTSFNNRKFEQGMNNWIGRSVYTTVQLPTYSSVRNAVLRSYENGYATAFDAHERRGGPHYNGHGNSTFSHIVVVDAYDSGNDQATIVDCASSWWGGSSQPKFTYSLSSFVANFVNAPDWGYRDGIGMYYAK